MNGNDENRIHAPFKIPGRIKNQSGGVVSPSPKTEAAAPLPGGMFYEIEYADSPFPGVGKFVLKPQKIEEPEKDEIRELFGRMREIAKAYRFRYDFSSNFFERGRSGDAALFYRQALFMKDFTDDYTGNAPFSHYFPHYQMMGYEQLRTYFTWRTEVRKGSVLNTSLSYAFLYAYELLCNIGAETPQDGLDKLLFFWRNFSKFNNAVDKYMLRWLKDYHIYYGLPQPFKEFAEKNGLIAYYPKMAETDGGFGLLRAVSKYDVAKSAFFTAETSRMTADCFSFVIERIRRDFEAAGIRFDDALFRPARRVTAWQPFKDALFVNWLKQPDRRVVLSENEIYQCKNNEWIFSSVITTEKGRQFVGYVMKKTEAVLRQITKYKYKLTANTDMIHAETLRILTKAGLFIDKIVPAAVAEFYKEATKTVVTVDRAALERIRREALLTQEALIVEEQTKQTDAAPIPSVLSAREQNIFADAPDAAAPESDAWAVLKAAFSDDELVALSSLLSGGDMRAFAAARGLLPEVLADGINEKAADLIGDNLMDEEFVLYDDYRELLKEWIK